MNEGFFCCQVEPEPRAGHLFDGLVDLLELAFRRHPWPSHCLRRRLQEEAHRLLRQVGLGYLYLIVIKLVAFSLQKEAHCSVQV